MQFDPLFRYFDCSCRRCSDATECGSFISAVRCFKDCKGGPSYKSTCINVLMVTLSPFVSLNSVTAKVLSACNHTLLMIKTDVLRFLLVRLFAARGVPRLPFSVAMLKVFNENHCQKRKFTFVWVALKQILYRCKSEVLQEQVSKNVDWAASLFFVWYFVVRL